MTLSVKNNEGILKVYDEAVLAVSCAGIFEVHRVQALLLLVIAVAACVRAICSYTI